MCAVLRTQVQFQVTRLPDEVNLTVRAREAARTQATHAPASNTVSTTAEIAFFIRQHGGVPIRESDTRPQVYSQRVALIEAKALGEIEISLNVLRISDVEQRVGIQLFRMRAI